MATTTNYSWETPDDTDLVKDGAAAIRTLGSSIDTTTKALNPSTTLGDIEYRSSTANTNTRLPIGTSGQVLSVVGGVPAWATTSDQTPLTTKGDIFTFTTVDARLGVGANDTVLTADSSTATGLKWATPGGGTKNYSLLNAGGTALTGADTITVTGISNKDSILVLVMGASMTTGASVNLRINTDSGSNYSRASAVINAATTYAASNFASNSSTSASAFSFGGTGTAAGTVSGYCKIDGAATAGLKVAVFGGSGNGADDCTNQYGGGVWNGSAVTSISIYTFSGTYDAGTVYVYTSA